MDIVTEILKQTPMAGVLLYLLIKSNNRNEELSDKILEVLPKLTGVVDNVHDMIKDSPNALKSTLEPLIKSVKDDTTDIKIILRK